MAYSSGTMTSNCLTSGCGKYRTREGHITDDRNRYCRPQKNEVLQKKGRQAKDCPALRGQG
jgi:hypothetical protein